jgi:N-acylneuraminate cytidylyltransferase
MKTAIIPARGGSKRIPNKNLKSFNGKPILAWSIRTAVESGIFDRIIVSTDSPQIAETAIQFGAEAPFTRPEELSTDHTGTIEVIQHAITWLQEHEYQPEYVCCIYATAPFLQSQYLQQGLKILQKSDASYAFSVCSFPAPIQRALGINDDHRVEAKYPEHIFSRSQDLREYYHDAGQFYWGTAEAFINNHTIFSDASIAIPLPRHLVQDIDTMEDWVRGEHMFRSLISSGEINH